MLTIISQHYISIYFNVSTCLNNVHLWLARLTKASKVIPVSDKASDTVGVSTLWTQHAGQTKLQHQSLEPDSKYGSLVAFFLPLTF